MTAVGGSSTAGTKLKAQSGWSLKETDDYGFSALSGGYYSNSSGTFGNVGVFGYWWSASEYSSSNAYSRYMDHRFEYVNSINVGKSDRLYSVRYLQD